MAWPAKGPGSGPFNVCDLLDDGIADQQRRVDAGHVRREKLAEARIQKQSLANRIGGRRCIRFRGSRRSQARAASLCEEDEGANEIESSARNRNAVSLANLSLLRSSATAGLRLRRYAIICHRSCSGKPPHPGMPLKASPFLINHASSPSVAFWMRSLLQARAVLLCPSAFSP